MQNDVPRPPLSTPRGRAGVRRVLGAVLLLAAVMVLTPRDAAAAPRSSSVTTPDRWTWPISAPRIVVRGYEAPATRYAAGHRGIDLEAAVGSPVVAADAGVVSFAGTVVDRPVLSIRHSGGLVSSYEPVVALVAEGDSVVAGQLVGHLGTGGHCQGCLHLGARLDGEYLSPLTPLGGVPRAVLLPLE